MQRFDLRVWLLPAVWRYFIAVVGVAAVLTFRYATRDVFQSTAPLIFFTIPVALAAFMGGLGPGLLATALSLLVGTYFFLDEPFSFKIVNTNDRMLIVIYAAIWTFITIICDLLRRAAVDYRLVAAERDAQRESYRAILGSIGDPFFAVDREWKITHANASFMALVGNSDESLVGSTLWQVLPENLQSCVRAQIEEAMASGVAVAFDFPAQQEAKWFHLRAFPYLQGLYCYLQDASDRIEMERRQQDLLAAERQARINLEQTSRLKDEFVATLSHELRTPLTTMLGWTEVLRSHPPDPSRIEEGLSAIERGARLQAQLISDLLDLSRLDTGKLKLDLEEIDLNDIAQEAVEASLPSSESKSIRVFVHKSDEPAIVRADSGRIHQILTNLLSNAIKFTPNGGEVKVAVTRTGNELTLSVADNGDGIESDFLPHVFGRFRQADATRSRRHGGLGLGLSIIKQLAELHSGRVKAESEGLGKGSTFSLTLPIAAVTAEERRAFVLGSQDLQPLAGITLLLVDDDPNARELLNVVLSEQGANLKFVESAAEALESIKVEPPDVLISDIGMPVMDGYEFISKVRQLPPGKGGDIPAIALTAFAREEDRMRAYKAGYQAYLPKPVHTPNLVATIIELAGNRLSLGRADRRATVSG